MVDNQPLAGGITTTFRLLTALATTNAHVVKAVPAMLYKVTGYNAAAAVRYLKLFNLSVAPTVGTSVPFKTLALAPSAAFDIDWHSPYFLDLGLSFAITAGAADTDTTALTAGDIVGLNIDYA